MFKKLAKEQGYNEIEGVNQLVYEKDPNYLCDLQTQKKRQFFPTMADTSYEFSHLHVPASRYL